MYLPKNLVTAIVVLIGMVLCQLQSVAYQHPPKTLALEWYLVNTCPHLGCHVIVEDLAYGRIMNTCVPNDQSITTTNQLIDFLRKEVDQATVTLLPNEVVRIRERQLANDSSYSLDKKLSINYSGGLAGLPNAIGGRLNGTVKNVCGGDISMINNYDFSSKITLSAKNETVRSILTDHLELSDYYTFLWIAETRVENGKEVTYVNFFTRKHMFQ